MVFPLINGLRAHALRSAPMLKFTCWWWLCLAAHFASWPVQMVNGAICLLFCRHYWNSQEPSQLDYIAKKNGAHRDRFNDDLAVFFCSSKMQNAFLTSLLLLCLLLCIVMELKYCKNSTRIADLWHKLSLLTGFNSTQKIISSFVQRSFSSNQCWRVLSRFSAHLFLPPLRIYLMNSIIP